MLCLFHFLAKFTINEFGWQCKNNIIMRWIAALAALLLSCSKCRKCWKIWILCFSHIKTFFPTYMLCTSKSWRHYWCKNIRGSHPFIIVISWFHLYKGSTKSDQFLKNEFCLYHLSLEYQSINQDLQNQQLLVLYLYHQLYKMNFRFHPIILCHSLAIATMIYRWKYKNCHLILMGPLDTPW